MSDTIDYNKLAEANARALATHLGVSSSGGGSKPGGSGFNFGGQFESVINSTISGFAKVAGGSATVSDALGLMSSALGNIPIVGNNISFLFTTLGQGVIDANKSLNEMGKTGVTFGNNLGLMASSVTGARLTIDEFQNMISKGATSIAMLGGSADKGAKNFLDLSKEIQEQPIVQSLVAAGVSTKELNELTLITMSNRRRFDIEDTAQKAAAVESTSRLAQEMDLIARLTGKSREQQQRDLEAGLMKAEVQATLNQLDDEARMNYMNMRVAIGPLGQNIQGLADEIISGGVRTAEGSAKMAALGPAGAAFEAAIKQSMSATTTAEKEAASRALDRAKADVAAYQASEAYASQLKYDTTVVGQMAREQYSQNADGAAKMARLNEAMTIMQDAQRRGVTMTTTEALTQAEANAKARELEKQTGFQKDAEGREGSTVARALNQANAVLKDQTAGLGSNFEKLNTEVGKFLTSQTEGIQKFNGVLSRMTQLDAELAQREIFIRAAQTMKTENAAEPVSAGPNFNPGAMPEPVKKSTGSLGTVGKFIEDFGSGTLAMLHGREGVVTEDQLKSLVSETFSMGRGSFDPKSMLSSMLDDISGGIRTAEEAAKAATVAATTMASSADSREAIQPQVIIPPAMNDLAQGINQLNMRMERLIAAVEDGADKTARAAKGKGNLLA